MEIYHWTPWCKGSPELQPLSQDDPYTTYLLTRKYSTSKYDEILEILALSKDVQCYTLDILTDQELLDYTY